MRLPSVVTPLMKRSVISLLLVAISLAWIGGCSSMKTQKRELIPPEQYASLDDSSLFLKAHMRDGSVYILSPWRVDEESREVIGTGQLLNANRRVLSQDEFTIPVDSVAIFETNVVRMSATIAPLAIVTAASLTLTTVCITNPKACFGSCPTFYVHDGREWHLEAEGFPLAVAPSLERSDLDALPRARPHKGRVQLGVTNEALETHLIRRADLLALECPEGERVFATPDGRFLRTLEALRPHRAEGSEGSCLEEILALDGAERTSAADSFDLAAKETIEIEFPYVEEGEWGVVIAARQSLMTTFIFYQTLAYMGQSAGHFFAALERGATEGIDLAHGIHDHLGGIEVWMEDGTSEAYHAGRFQEFGPIATDHKILPLRVTQSGPCRVTLELTRGQWRIDWVALARVLDEAEPVRIEPADIDRRGLPDEDALSRLRDPHQLLMTLPGDTLTISYPMPAGTSEWALFLDSRGYYLEWIREAWVKEENPGRLATMLLDPRAALRHLAPEFKAVEPGMDDVFWKSRYGRP
jgi:hypothetical protein